jgi:hypothetical protein
MIAYTIDYTHGIAKFYTEQIDELLALREFRDCASSCFGIRKSMENPRITRIKIYEPLPEEYQGKDATHFLTFAGDEVLFDSRYRNTSGEPWILHDGSGNWCTCETRGVEELTCDVHHFWVFDHNEKCNCRKGGRKL